MGNRQTILSPLRGIRYRLGAPDELSDLIAPPFDIVSEQVQAELHARHPHNFIRVELPEDGSGRYARAADALRDWLAAGVLIRDRAPSLYLLEQEFRVGERALKRTGLFALVRLPEPGEAYVLAHEGTLPEPKADRLRLMRACQAMTSPIMLIAEDREAELLRLMEQTKRAPDALATGPAGVGHRLWVIEGRAAIEAACASVGPGPLFIADGHHRFETALAYRDEMRSANPQAADDAAFNYALALVTSARDRGLEIFPTHRLVACPNEDARQTALGLMREYFEVNRWPLPDPASLGRQPWLEGISPERHVFGAYCGDGSYYVLTARDDVLRAAGSVVEGLDVSILHRYLIDPILSGSGPVPDTDGRVSHDADTTGEACRGAPLRYVTDEQQAVAAVGRGDYHFALFLRPTRVSDVIAAARAGERMPGKSTYFYPKVPAGIVIADASAEPI